MVRSAVQDELNMKTGEKDFASMHGKNVIFHRVPEKRFDNVEGGKEFKRR